VIKVPYIDLASQWNDIRLEALPLIDEVLSTGKYLEHEIVETLESDLAAYLDVKHVVLVNSGTDALVLALQALDVGSGDEVITVPNSFIASVAAIHHVGASPVMVDVSADHLIDVDQIESAITPKTKAIMPVHLEGKVCNMERIIAIARKYNLLVFEDAAQAFGSKFDEKMSGSQSDAACFSLHPLKNLNACGDGGFVATNKIAVAERIKSLRNHGQKSRNDSEEFGVVSRFDSIQAAIVKIRLKRVENVITTRRANAKIYDRAFEKSGVVTPVYDPRVFHTYHLYVVEISKRDDVKAELLNRGIDTRIHYPNLITDQTAYKERFSTHLKAIPMAMLQKSRILSLPIHHHLSEEQISWTAETLRAIHD
jgi:dTDP-4-amino-4,6-dideoxygalactose transaminase